MSIRDYISKGSLKGKGGIYEMRKHLVVLIAVLICLLITIMSDSTGYSVSEDQRMSVRKPQITSSIRQDSPNYHPRIRNMVFNGDKLAWLLTSTGDLWFTKDSGAIWEQISLPADIKLLCLNFINSQRGWAVSKEGSILSSKDGGRTWISIGKLEASKGEYWNFNSASQIQFVDESNGWIIESLSIWRTVDGGRNWERCFNVSDLGVNGQPIRGFFLNPNRGWVCGTNGEIYITGNGGKTWKIERVPEDLDLTDIFFTDEYMGWVCGYGGAGRAGQIYRTENGGKTWELYKGANYNSYIYSIQFINRKEGWAAGTRRLRDSQGNVLDEGLILRTEDGGISWDVVRTIKYPTSFEQIYFMNKSRGWLISKEAAYVTDNEGINWRVVFGPKD